ncbi:MAG: hypothetical protein ACK501_13260 [Planctomycetota bacterium]
MTTAPSTAESGGRVFVAAIVLAAVGAVAFLLGLGAAFGRAGNWANDLAGLGILLLIAGGVANLVAFVMGARSMMARRSFHWWWLGSAALVAASVLGGLEALSL